MIRKARSNVRFIYRTKAFSLKLVLKGAIKRKFIPETSANFDRLLETSLSQREIRIFQGLDWDFPSVPLFSPGEDYVSNQKYLVRVAFSNQW